MFKTKEQLLTEFGDFAENINSSIVWYFNEHYPDADPMDIAFHLCDAFKRIVWDIEEEFEEEKE